MKKGVLAAIILFFLLAVSMGFSQDNEINSNDKVDNEVEDLLQQQDEVSVIVVLEDDDNALDGYSASALNTMDDFEKEKMMIAKQQENVLNELDSTDFELKRQFTSLNGLSGNVTLEGLEKLKNDPNVKSIQLNGIKSFVLDGSVPLVNATNTWRLIYNNTNITGKGETICVIDSGIDYTHPALGGCTTDDFLAGNCGKVLAGHDFKNDDTNPIDDQGHGTHVAGIIASKNETYRGVAPDANLVALKVCDNSAGGNCADADIISAIDWCVNNRTKYNISVISISLGGGLFSTYCDDEPTEANLKTPIDNAIGKNISVIIASGNSGSISQISSPACIRNATAIGSVTKSDGISSFSNRNSITDLLAPGGSNSVGITSTVPTGSCINCHSSGFLALSGTSMATPHVAGSFALLQQYFKLTENRTATPAEIEDKLNDTGKQIIDSGGSGLAFSRINIFAAILSLDQTAPDITFLSSTLANKTNSTNANFFINITSNEVLLNATLEFNGTNETMEGSGLNWFKSKTLDSGVYFYKVWGNDSAGNMGLSELRLIQINNTAPNITSFFPLALVHSINEPNNQTFNITYNDLEGDVATVSWYRNSTLVSTSYEFNFTGNFTSAGFFNITVTIADAGDSSVLTWNFTINNTNQVPTIESVTLNSTDSLNRTNGTLQGFFTTSDPENDVITANETKWYNSTKEVPELKNYTSITSNYTLKHQNWTFSVRVFDGNDWGNWVNSTNLTIINSNPAINITIQNITIDESDLADINLSGNLGAADNDNDTLTFAYSSPLNSSGEWQTGFTDARNYTITINVSDGDNGLDTQNIILEVLDKVNGENDTIAGNITDIKTNVQNLELRINNLTFNSSKTFVGVQDINFSDGDLTLAVFDFNFTNTTKFSFVNIKINRTKSGNAESLVIKGIDLSSQSRKKTLYLNRTDTSLNSVCVKDDEINSIDDFLDLGCTASGGTELACDGIATSGFTCTLEGNLYKITGLSHSGIKQISYTRPSDSGSSNGGGSSGGGGGGGGGGGSGPSYTCNMDWSCSVWSECDGTWETRECNFIKVGQHTQSTECPSISNVPGMARKCGIEAIAFQAADTGEAAEANKNESSSMQQITGMAAADSKSGIRSIVVGIIIVAMVVVSGLFVYFAKFTGKR